MTVKQVKEILLESVSPYPFDNTSKEKESGYHEALDVVWKKLDDIIEKSKVEEAN
jgi:hypothetical protein